MTRLSVTIITRNEEHDLPDALRSVAETADEIVVVDCGSTDRTCELAREAGARVLTREWTDYSGQKNFAAENAVHDWIFNLDADERLSPELADSLRRWKDAEPAAAAYRCSRRNHYLGGWVRHGGWYPDRKVRLYHRHKAKFLGTVHESLRVDGPVADLDGDLLHFTMRTRRDHDERTERYATLAARQAYEAGRRSWRLPLLLSPGWAFVNAYLLRLGWLDGWRGWRIAVMSSRYAALKYRKLGGLVRGESR